MTEAKNLLCVFFFKLYLLNNIWMLKVLQERDLSNSSTWYTIVFLLESDLFDGNEFACFLV